ncbi:glycosyltransferase [Flammeovirga sp. SubArs3]|uniref:glycosyltransferase family protein n=1 Tax=Flammeovirga sp. SubArs3 TaxID=2995316 RepID=UPI00248B1D9A|nr:glycosyltransferase [Flammeovirga sp. SubArs3]
MKLTYIYQNYRKSYTGLGETFLREFLAEGIDLSVFEFKNLTNNRYLNKIFSIFLINKLFFKYQNKKLIKSIKKNQSTHVFIFKGTDLHENILKKISQEDVNISGFNPDDPFNKQSCKDNIEKSLPYYDSYFIWSKNLIKKIKQKGIKKVLYLPFAVDPQIIYPVKLNNYIYDITFVGNSDKKRVKQIIDLAEKVEGNIKIDVFGFGWPTIKNVTIHPQVNESEYLKVISNSKLNINILREQNIGSNNMRTFEIPAAAGIMIHEDSHEVREIFNNQTGIYYFKNSSDIINTYYEVNRDINKIQKEVDLFSEKIKSDTHVYNNRIKTIIENL